MHECDYVTVILIQGVRRALLMRAASVVNLTGRASMAAAAGSVSGLDRPCPGDKERLAHEAAVRRVPLCCPSCADVDLDDALIREMADGSATGGEPTKPADAFNLKA